ncbi:ATP synthase protein I [Brachybacterium sp. SW0106-09]|nr:ATP synthase protein I [Brachybacterium sp. SW0106-09]
MQRATLIAAGVGLVADLVLLAIAAIRPESAALFGALVGTGLTLAIVLPTVAITFAGPRLTPVSMAATVLGSWAVKMFAVILVLLLVRDVESVSSTWIGLALLVGAVSAVLIEAVVLARTRQPLDVDPAASPDEHS